MGGGGCLLCYKSGEPVSLFSVIDSRSGRNCSSNRYLVFYLGFVIKSFSCVVAPFFLPYAIIGNKPWGLFDRLRGSAAELNFTSHKPQSLPLIHKVSTIEILRWLHELRRSKL